MARRQILEEETPPDARRPRRDSEKVGVTLDGRTLWRFRIYCETERLKPSQMIQQLIMDRLRGFALPKGAVYKPRRRPDESDTSDDSREDREAA